MTSKVFNNIYDNYPYLDISF